MLWCCRLEAVAMSAVLHSMHRPECTVNFRDALTSWPVQAGVLILCQQLEHLTSNFTSHGRLEHLSMRPVAHVALASYYICCLFSHTTQQRLQYLSQGKMSWSKVVQHYTLGRSRGQLTVTASHINQVKCSTSQTCLKYLKWRLTC